MRGSLVENVIIYMCIYIIIAVGSTSVEILVVIINDDEPEVDESFEVQLVSVAESSSQMIDSEQVRMKFYITQSCKQ